MENFWPRWINWPELRWREERDRMERLRQAADAEADAMIERERIRREVQREQERMRANMGNMQNQLGGGWAQAQAQANQWEYANEQAARLQQQYELARAQANAAGQYGGFVQVNQGMWVADAVGPPARRSAQHVSPTQRRLLRETFDEEIREMLLRLKGQKRRLFEQIRDIMPNTSLDYLIAMSLRDNLKDRISQKLSLCGRLGYMLDENSPYQDPLKAADEDAKHGSLFHPTDEWNTSGVLCVKCPSTGKKHALFVPKRLQTAKEARAWTFGLSAKEFELAVET